MQNRIHYIFALCAAFGAFNFASTLVDDASPASVGLGARFALAQDDDPFGDDSDDDDPFAAADSEESSETPPESVADDPFVQNPSAGTPFAPSSLPAGNADAPREDLTPEEKARAEERAKYARAEDVPDEYKTEADFYETANAAERSVLRETPPNDAEWFAAAVRVSRVGRPSFAKLLVEKAVDAPAADPKASAAVLDALGTGRATYFVANPEIGLVGASVYDKVLASARQYWESDEALRDAFRRASAGSVSERARGITDARKGGASAIKALVVDLIGSSEERRQTATELLPFFEEDAVSALIACVRTATDEQLPSFVEALADFSDVRVGPELAARYYLDSRDEGKIALEKALSKQYSEIPSAEDVAGRAYEDALEYYRNQKRLPNVVDGVAVVWDWNARGESLARVELPVDSITRMEAARLALVSYLVGRGIGAVPPGVQELAIAAVAERAAYRVGLDSPRQGVAGFEAELPNLAAPELVAGLKYALDSEHYVGALIPAVLLQERGDESLCYGDGGSTPITRAATCPDRRVRYQALAAIVRWNPEKPYPGSSRVASGLEWFASASGERVVVVADPQLANASQIGQAFALAGFRVIPASTGRAALLAARNNADVELVFATSRVSEPTIETLAQALRGDARTRDVPLLVGADSERDAIDANVRVGREENVAILPVPRDVEAASQAIQMLGETSKIKPVPAELRRVEAKAAASGLLKLLTTRPKIYELDNVNELIRSLLARPALFDEGLEFAASIKTGYAQNALVQLAGDTRYGADVRDRVVDAFERQASTGLLLRGPEVAAMYDRYNASEKEDVQTQRILSRLLDVYEAAVKK